MRFMPLWTNIYHFDPRVVFLLLSSPSVVPCTSSYACSKSSVIKIHAKQISMIDGVEEVGEGDVQRREKQCIRNSEILYPPTAENGFALSAETYLNQKLSMIVMLPVTTQKKRKLKALLN